MLGGIELFISKNAVLFTLTALVIFWVIFLSYNSYVKRKGRSSLINGNSLTAIFGFFGLIFVILQMSQSNSHKKWDNYNSMNQAYGSLYANISTDMLDKPCRHFSQLSKSEKKWIRNYFDLYAEEYWLDQRGLIPKDMFRKLIAGGVRVNFKQYPIMITGYSYWLNEGAFQYPDGFRDYIEDIISNEWKEEILASTKQKCGGTNILPESFF